MSIKRSVNTLYFHMDYELYKVNILRRKSNTNYVVRLLRYSTLSKQYMLGSFSEDRILLIESKRLGGYDGTLYRTDGNRLTGSKFFHESEREVIDEVIKVLETKMKPAKTRLEELDKLDNLAKLIFKI